MPKARFIDIEEMKRIFIYNPETGDLIWKERDTSMFKDEHAAKSFNNRKAGEIVGSIRKNKNGKSYLAVKVGRYTHLVHRICWAMYKN
ncbi:hypothetical protein KKJ23_25095, partial [Xenorhabdus bovienii]|nr:hypothetical protein [Xenorhabdus bovienii]